MIKQQLSTVFSRILFVLASAAFLSSCFDGKNASTDDLQHGVVFLAREGSSTSEHNYALYKSDWSGKHLERITSKEYSGSIIDFKISADGRYLAYKQYVGADFHPTISVTDLFYSPENALTNRFEYPRTMTFDHVTEYEWSPTGSQLLFNQYDALVSTNTHLYLLDPEAGHVRQLTFADNVGAVQWSPTGTHIVFTRVLNLDYSTVRYSTLNVNDLTMADITQPLMPGEQIYNDGYVWSPTGEHIVYVLDEISSSSQLHAVRVDGTEHTLLSGDFFGVPETIKWSPSGSTVLYLADSSNGPQIFTIKPDGSDLTQISNLQSRDEQLSLSEWVNDGFIFYSKQVPDLTHGYVENRYITDSLGIVSQDISSPTSNDMYTGAFVASPNSLYFLLLSTNYVETKIENHDVSGTTIATVKLKQNIASIYGYSSWMPEWSHDSQYFHSMTTSLPDNLRSILISDVQGNPVLSIPDSLENYNYFDHYENFQWSKDSKYGIFRAVYSQPTEPALFSIPIGSMYATKLSGNLRVGTGAKDIIIY